MKPPLALSRLLLRTLPFALLLPFSSCNKDILSVHTEYITIESLSSYYIGTPDPKLNNPPFGQKLVVEWELPKEYTCTAETVLALTIRYRDRTEENLSIGIKKRSGRYVFCLNGDKYCEHGEILTYKVQLFDRDCLLEEWKHQLWAELILFEEETEEIEEGDEEVCAECPPECCEEREKSLEEIYEETQFIP